MMKYQIPRRASACCAKSELFEEGEEIFSLLIPMKSGFERRDFCKSCWKEPADLDACFWRVVLPTKESKHAMPRDLSVLEHFYTLLDQEDKKDALYILALYLERRGLFAKRKENFFENLKTGELFHVQSAPVHALHLELVVKGVDF